MRDFNRQLRARESRVPEDDHAPGLRVRPERYAGAKSGQTVCTRMLLILVASSCGFVLQACRESQTSKNSTAGSDSQESAVSTTPPYSTREPERYQATRVITSQATTSSSTPSIANQTVKILIARDGAKRREEYVSPDQERIVYLETSAGRFILLPDSKVYAIWGSDQNESGGALADPAGDPAAVSIDELLNDVVQSAKYQTLGTEVLGGRATTKYRVTTEKSSGETNRQSETLIWIDETLGMPVRSETTDGGESSVKVIMELKDITLTVNEQLFEIPGDYKKVAFDLIQQQRKKASKARDQ